MPLISYVKTATNKPLFISESHSDWNRCTPCRGKPDQHDMYTSHTSPRMPDVRFLWAVPVCGKPFTLTQQSWTYSLLPKKVMLTPPLILAEWPVRPASVSLPTQSLKQCA
jgi:hypothetical protein